MSRRGFRATTYSYCGEDILELVDERDKRRVIHVDAVRVSLATCTHPRGAVEIGTRRTPTGLGWTPWLAGVQQCGALQVRAVFSSAGAQAEIYVGSVCSLVSRFGVGFGRRVAVACERT